MIKTLALFFQTIVVLALVKLAKDLNNHKTKDDLETIFKPYPNDTLVACLDYYEKREEYEACVLVRDEIERRKSS